MQYAVFFACLCCCAFATTTLASSDRAFGKSYTLSSPGFTELLFTNHNGSDYDYQPIYNPDLDQILTRNTGQFDAPHPGLMWHNAGADFNVTVTLDLLETVRPTRLNVLGTCCNMGLFTPTAIYLHGSTTGDQGPWTLVGATAGLTSGDQIETPATKFQLHLHVSTELSFRFFRLDITGAADRYIGLTTIQLYD